jgi:predicted Zn-dependent protease
MRRVDDARALIAAVLHDEPNFVPALLLRGNLEVAVNQRAAAEATFQQILDVENGAKVHTQAYAMALAQLIDVELALGKVESAAVNADALLKLDGRNPIARYMKAAVEVRQNDLTGAERRLEWLIADVPQYWPAHRLLGEINVRQDQLGQAVMYLRTAVTNNPADSGARLQLAELYVRQGNVDAARQLMEESKVDVNSALFLAFVGRASQQAGLDEQAENYFDQSEQRVPTSVSELVSLSSMYLAAGEFERAIHVLQRASFADPQSAQISNYMLALIQVRQGDLKAADATAERIQQAQATAAWPLDLRGMIALAGRDFARSRDFLSKALELEPKNVATLLNFARLAAAQNDRAQLEQYLRRATDLEPTQPLALFGLAQLAAERNDFAGAHALLARAPASSARVRAEGDVLVREGKFAEAADLFAQAFATEPAEDLALRAYDAATKAKRPRPEAQLLTWSTGHPRAIAANFTLGALALTKNDRDDAVKRFEAVIAESPNHTATLNNLAWLYGERRDPRAIEFAERARQGDPNNPAIADTLGWLYVQNGEAAKGLPLVAAAAAALRDQREVQYHWAIALAETGDSAKALEILRSLLAAGSDFPGRADAAQRLAALQGSKP